MRRLLTEWGLTARLSGGAVDTLVALLSPVPHARPTACDALKLPWVQEGTRAQLYYSPVPMPMPFVDTGSVHAVAAPTGAKAVAVPSWEEKTEGGEAEEDTATTVV